MDRVWATLNIPLSMYRDNVREACEDYVDHYGGSIYMLENLGLVQLENSEAIDGEFENLERFLVAIEVPFDRYTSQDVNVPEGKRVYRPATDKQEKIDAYIRLCEKTRFMYAHEIEAYMDADGDDFKSMLTEAMEVLCFDDYPSLEDYND